MQFNCRGCAPGGWGGGRNESSQGFPAVPHQKAAARGGCGVGAAGRRSWAPATGSPVRTPGGAPAAARRSVSGAAAPWAPAAAAPADRPAPQKSRGPGPGACGRATSASPPRPEPVAAAARAGPAERAGRRGGAAASGSGTPCSRSAGGAAARRECAARAGARPPGLQPRPPRAPRPRPPPTAARPRAAPSREKPQPRPACTFPPVASRRLRPRPAEVGGGPRGMGRSRLRGPGGAPSPPHTPGPTPVAAPAPPQGVFACWGSCPGRPEGHCLLCEGTVLAPPPPPVRSGPRRQPHRPGESLGQRT